MTGQADSEIVSRSWKPALAYGAGFCLPICILCVVALASGVYPFGEQSFLTEDLKYQYIDFFTWYKSVLEGKESLLYSFNLSLGVGTWGLYSYYLASPFNLLLVFFDLDSLTAFAWLTTCLKVGCMQVATMCYVRHRFGLPWVETILLALSFTCSLWVITNIRNIIWLDSLVVLPLAALGVARLVDSGKWGLLLFSVAAAVVLNWYMAYMIILFLGMVFVVEVVLCSRDHSAKVFLRRFAQFVAVVLFALCLASFTFLPTVLAMRGSLSELPVFNHVGYLGGDWDEGLRALSGLYFGGWADLAVPQLATSSLALVAAASLLFCRQAPLRSRIALLALCFVLFCVCWVYPLYVAFCGMRVPIGFYCRTGYLFAFSVVMAAAYAFSCYREGVVAKPVPICAALVHVALLIALAAMGDYLGGRVALLLCAALLLTSGLVLAAYLHYPLSRIPALAALFVTVVEVVLVGYLAWTALYVDYSQERHDEYVSTAREQIEELSAYDSSVYRIGKGYTRIYNAALNEGLALGYLQLSSYTSVNNINAINFLARLGYTNPGWFSATCLHANVVADSLLGVKYFCATNCPQGYEDVGLQSEYRGAKYYANPYALSLGYCADDAILGTSADSGSSANPFEYQNNVIESLTGKQQPCFQKLEGKEVLKQGDRTEWSISVPKGSDRMLFAYVESSRDVGWVHVSVDGAEPLLQNDRFSHFVIAVSKNWESGVEHTVSVSGKDADDLDVMFYALDRDALEDVYAELAQDQLEHIEIEGATLQGTVRCTDSSKPWLFVSIPPDSGWRIWVNGKGVDAQPVLGGAGMAIPVAPGENTLEMRYETPGLPAGCAVTGIALLALLLRSLWKASRKRSA